MHTTARTCLIAGLVLLAGPAAANGCRDVPTTGHTWNGTCTYKHDKFHRDMNPLEKLIAEWMGPLCGPQTGKPC